MTLIDEKPKRRYTKWVVTFLLLLIILALVKVKYG